MSLIKNKSHKGFTGEYHRIKQLNMHYDRLSAVVDVALYKDKATRDEDENAVMETFKIDLGSYFHDKNYTNGEDVMKNVSLKEAYKALDVMAKEEEAKRAKLPEGESLNEDLTFFADAVEG